MAHKLVLILILFLSKAMAYEFNPKVFSRSIMPHCNYIYSVESDVKIHIHETDERFFLKTWFDNTWTEEEERLEIIEPLEIKNSKLLFSFNSMSIPKSYLYRIMYFSFGKIEDGEFISHSRNYKVDIGRRFGERCNTSRNAAYHKRPIELE